MAMDTPVSGLQIYWKKNSKIIAMHQHGCAAQVCYLFVVSSRQRIFRLKHIIVNSLFG